MTFSTGRWIGAVGAIVLLGAGALYLWLDRDADELDEGLYAGNGRVEATEVKVATKYPGRLVDVVPKEGDEVEQGAVVARLDNREALADLAQARAEFERVTHVVHSARAEIERRNRELALSESQLERTEQLFERGSTSQQQLDRDTASMRTAAAAAEAARGNLMQAVAQLSAAEARIDRAEAIVEEMEISAPISGRVLFRTAEPGEIIQAGGNILLLVDLDRPYMTIFLDEVSSGRVDIGDDALIWTDAYPQEPFAATVSFVSDEAEFTPKQVQTPEERQNLVFRVKLTAADNSRKMLKPGMPGVGLIRTDSNIPWPQSQPHG